MSNATVPDGTLRNRLEEQALQVLAVCIGEVVGVRSDVYATLARALVSGNPLDMHLARHAFDALTPDERREIMVRVRSMRPTGTAGPDAMPAHET